MQKPLNATFIKKWHNDIEQMLSAHSIHSLNTFSSNLLNLSVSPFRNTSSFAKTAKCHFPLSAKASKSKGEPIGRCKSNHMISRWMTVCVWAGIQLLSCKLLSSFVQHYSGNDRILQVASKHNSVPFAAAKRTFYCVLLSKEVDFHTWTWLVLQQKTVKFVKYQWID